MNDRARRAVPVLCGLAAAASLFLGVAPLLGIPCDTCTGGPLPSILPWIGLAFYATLAGLSARRPDSSLLPPLLTLAVFAHASLITESLLHGRLCPGCVAVALFAAAAAFARAGRATSELVGLGTALALGTGSGFFHPVDRVDGILLRTFAPAKLHDRLPEHVDRSLLDDCGHGTSARLILFEKNCSSCRSIVTGMLPRLHREFPGRVCAHVQPPGGGAHVHSSPLLIVTSPRGGLVVVEGHPSYEDLRGIVESFAGAPKS